MAFTYSAGSIGGTLQTGSVSIEVSPSSGVLAETIMPGGLVSTVINVSNTGDVDEFYFVTADWKASGTTSESLAALLAYNLNVSVEANTTNLYTGKLKDLIDRPDSPGRELPLATGAEDVTFQFSLPSAVGNAVQDIDLAIDFIFVATS
ncbi:MAG: hypothetical protein GX969_04580 [Firmicutes bacterium]|nr:hypothetical protein [Bacillota bacterium]